MFDFLAASTGRARPIKSASSRPMERLSAREPSRTAVLMRQACHLRLRTAVYHWARVAIQHDVRSRARYAKLRKRGHSHGRALRSVADRLLAVACAMLKSQTTFDPEHA